MKLHTLLPETPQSMCAKFEVCMLNSLLSVDTQKLNYSEKCDLYQCAGKRTRDEKQKETPLKTIETQNSNSLATAYIEYKYEKIAKNADFGVLVRPLPMNRFLWNYAHFFPRPPRVCMQNLKSVGCIVSCPWTLKNRQIQRSATYRFIHIFIYIWQKWFRLLFWNYYSHR